MLPPITPQKLLWKIYTLFSHQTNNIFNPSWKIQKIYFQHKKLKWKTETYILGVILVLGSILAKGKFLIMILFFD